ncbi:MAG: WD40/YVTN/BNR-like repeat-containing protein [Cyclobacteriaceae bacterium]
MSNKLLLGTAKGLILYEKGSSGWKYAKDFFKGFSISLVARNDNDHSWWIGLDHKHWGPKLHRSKDEGATWEEMGIPKYPDDVEIKPGLSATLRYLWSFANGGADQPDVVHIGTEPGGLFKSTDGGASFQLDQNLWDHPSRMDHWFGGGRNHPGIHSIVIDPRDNNHIYVGISCAGVFETKDGGVSWQPRNKGLRADFLPNPDVEVGQDPHLVLACRSNPDVIWQQNHCGVFRSANAGVTWSDVSDPKGLSNYGFSLAIDDDHPERAWVMPATSDEMRIAVDGALYLNYTEDGGVTWQEIRNGLPQTHCFDIVLRHALDRYRDDMGFGTSGGSIFLSGDEGKSWNALNHHLPRVFAVKFV